MKRLARAAEAWIWTQIVVTVLGLAVVGAGAWVCWQAVKHVAQVFGL